MVSGCFCPQEGKNRGGLPGSRYRAWAGFRLHGEAKTLAAADGCCRPCGGCTIVTGAAGTPA